MPSILLAILFLLLGCAAPHDNPLDPNSKRYVAPPPAPYVPEFSAQVWSEHFPVSAFSEIYQLRAEFHNPDTSFALDSVRVIYDGWLPRGLRSDSLGTWGVNLDQSVFGCGQLMACVVGEPFTFYAHRADTAYSLGPEYLFRVISAVPTTVEPDSFDTVAPTGLTLQWNNYTSSFGSGWGFRANVLTGGDSTLWMSSLLARDQLVAYPALDSLAEGSYYWTVSVVDSFGNIARSQKAFFTVAGGGVPQ